MCQRMAYTTVDSLRSVVVSVVVSTTVVANCVDVGVGTQSPILPPRHGSLSLRRNQEQGEMLVVWYKSILPWLRSGSPSRLPSPSFSELQGTFASQSPSGLTSTRPTNISPAHHTSLPFLLVGATPNALTSSLKVNRHGIYRRKYTRSKSEIKTKEIGCGQAHSVLVCCSPPNFGISRSVWRESGSVVSMTPQTYQISLTALPPRWPGT